MPRASVTARRQISTPSCPKKEAEQRHGLPRARTAIARVPSDTFMTVCGWVPPSAKGAAPFSFRHHMSTQKPKTRTEAAKPAQTRHLTEADKRALDREAEAEHTDGRERERLTRKMAERK